MTEYDFRAAEKGLTDLKSHLSQAMVGLANVKEAVVRTRRDRDNQRLLAEDYERKAIQVLSRLKDGAVSQEEADRQATELLVRKADHDVEAKKRTEDLERLERSVPDLEAKVREIQETVRRSESELLSLKARARSAQAATRVMETVNRFDPSGAEDLLLRMRLAVESEEDLAAAYADMVDDKSRLDAEIDRALGGDPDAKVREDLARLKAKVRP